MEREELLRVITQTMQRVGQNLVNMETFIDLRSLINRPFIYICNRLNQCYFHSLHYRAAYIADYAESYVKVLLIFNRQDRISGCFSSVDIRALQFSSGFSGVVRLISAMIEGV